jgi:hypothetical protein
MMNVPELPDFVRRLPEADLPVVGLRGWLLQGESGQVLFHQSGVEGSGPEHSHADQWGMVVEGRLDLTIGRIATTYRRGDAYFIPQAVPHHARIYPGFRSVDYFADLDRYRPRQRDAASAPPKAR